jgi:hypothetical protein
MNRTRCLLLALAVTLLTLASRAPAQANTCDNNCQAKCLTCLANCGNNVTCADKCYSVEQTCISICNI